MNTPLVSVVIATWNTGEHLGETLDSVLAQSWPHLEVIVVDDGSTDLTPSVVQRFLPRIRYEPRPHGGLAAARNEGIRLARGEYIALLDADDLWHPEKLATQVGVALRHPASGMIVCDASEFAGDQVLKESLLSPALRRAVAESECGEATGDFQAELIAANGIACPGQVLIPRRVLDEVGPFRDSGAQDYDCYLRISQRFPITVHGDCHVRWRYRPDSMSGERLGRDIRWGLFTVPVLQAHRRRCRPEHRGLLDARITELVTDTGYRIMLGGRATGRRTATVELLRLLRQRPWPPTSLLHLAGLWSPRPAYRLGAALTRPFRPSE